MTTEVRACVMLNMAVAAFGTVSVHHTYPLALFPVTRGDASQHGSSEC